MGFKIRDVFFLMLGPWQHQTGGSPHPSVKIFSHLFSRYYIRCKRGVLHRVITCITGISSRYINRGSPQDLYTNNLKHKPRDINKLNNELFQFLAMIKTLISKISCLRVTAVALFSQAPLVGTKPPDTGILEILKTKTKP